MWRPLLFPFYQSETLIGMVAVAIALSVEEGLLELLPAYRGVPELAVGSSGTPRDLPRPC